MDTQKMLLRGTCGGMSPPSPALNQAAAGCPQWVEPGLSPMYKWGLNLGDIEGELECARHPAQAFPAPEPIFCLGSVSVMLDWARASGELESTLVARAHCEFLEILRASLTCWH